MSIVLKTSQAKKNTKQKKNTKDQLGESVNGATIKKGAGGDHTKLHEALLKKVLLTLSSNGYFVYKNNTGAIKTNDRYQAYGLPGSADILGIQPITGRFLALEVKTGNAKQNKQQLAFEKAVLKRNGIYKIIRSLEDIDEFITFFGLRDDTPIS